MATDSVMSPPCEPAGAMWLIRTSFIVILKKSFCPSPDLRATTVTVAKCLPWAQCLASTGDALS